MNIDDPRFLICIKHLFNTEGGYNNIKQDRGGATNFGISLKFAQSAAARFDVDLDNDGDVDEQDMRLLTPEIAKALYYVFFWQPSKCSDIPAPFDGMVFDQTVNGLADTGIKLLQKAINAVNPSANLLIDGVYGQKTMRAAYDMAASNKNAGVVAFREAAIQRYNSIVSKNPSQKIFLAGWKNRANRLGTW